MKRLIVMLALAGAAGTLAACSDGPTEANRTVEGQPGMNRELPQEPVWPEYPSDPGDPGDPGNGGGGYTPPPPFSPPGQPYPIAGDLAYNYYTFYGATASCNQVTHAFFGYSNDVAQGTTLYLAGVTYPNYPMVWGVYDQSGARVKTVTTGNAGSNCVVNQVGMSTWDLAPGYYYLYASYMGLLPYIPPVPTNGPETSSGYASPIRGKFVSAIRVR